MRNQLGLKRNYFGAIFGRLKKLFRQEDIPHWRGWGISHWGARRLMFLVALQFAVTAHPLLANPYGGTVVAGGAQMENAGSVLNIQQTTDRAIIHWQGFSIAGQETTNFL